ncbi:hypothetical protein ANO11243_054510 [Dothideomycetidae sp. 11243]|nr:hypothetical protein ANO11243_054510 [fungal sp. No.11243]
MAFERLGFKPCMHMAELIAYADKARLLVEAESLLFPHNIESGRARRQEILHYLYDDYASASDFPAWLFAEDLMDMYPEAKIVLNQRKDPATWPTSIKRTLAFFGTSTYFYTCCLWTTDRLHYSMHQIVHALVPQMYGTNDLFSRELYDAHLDKVRRAAKERNKPILEWEATQGWQPICDFVGKPVPMNEPFPHANDEKEVKFMTRVLLTRGADRVDMAIYRKYQVLVI